jgi:hypothetical protein
MILANDKNSPNPEVFASRPLGPGFDGSPVYPKLKEYHDQYSKNEDNRMMPVKYLRNTQNKKIPIQSLTHDSLKDLKNNEINQWFLEEIKEKGLEQVKQNGFFIKMIKWRKIVKGESKPEIRNVMAAFHNSRLSYKNKMYYVNEGNYLLAIYKYRKEEKESRELIILAYWQIQPKRISELIPESLTDKKGNKFFLKTEDHGPQIFQLNKRVLLFEKTPVEIWEKPYSENLTRRLYLITGINSDTRMNFLIHNSTGYGNAANKSEKLVLRGGEYSHENIFPFHRISSSKVNALIEGIDFRLTYDGKLIKL